MNLFLSNGQKAEEAIYWGQKNVKDVLQDPTFITDVGLGLVSISYLGPEPRRPDENNDRSRLGGPSNFNQTGTSTLGTASIALMAVGGAVIMVFVASIFVWRRNRYDTAMQHSIYNATQTGGVSASPIMSSNLTISDGSGGDPRDHRAGDDDDDGDHPTSPFSEMLPSAYRFNDNMSIMSGRDGLSAVTEAAESSEEQLSDNSIAGFTADAVGNGGDESSLSFEMPQCLYTTKDNNTCATTVGTTTMAGTTQAGAGNGGGSSNGGGGGQQGLEESPAHLGARKRHENAITATQTANITSSPLVSDDEEMSEMTCSIIAPVQGKFKSRK